VNSRGKEGIPGPETFYWGKGTIKKITHSSRSSEASPRNGPGGHSSGGTANALEEKKNANRIRQGAKDEVKEEEVQGSAKGKKKTSPTKAPPPIGGKKPRRSK